MISCGEPTQEKEAPTVQRQTATSKIKLTSLSDEPVSLEQFKGKTVFINFWATWCRPCLQEMPSIKIAKELLTKNDVIFLFASDETNDQISEFEQQHDYNFSYVKLANIAELNIESLPTTWIFNPKGELVFSETGFRQWDDKNNIEMILKINDQK